MSALESLAEFDTPAASLDSPGASTGLPRASKRFDRDELNNSRPMRWSWTLGQAGDPALDALLAELEASVKRQRTRSGSARANLRTTLDALLAALVAAAAQDPTRFLAYSRNRNVYRPDRYATPGITHQAVIDVIGFLEGAKLVDHATGYLDRSANPFGGPGGFGRRSRIRASQTLLDRLVAFGLTSTSVQERGNAELIRRKGPAETRGGTKPLLNYEDTPETIRMRQSLETINAVLMAARIELPGPLPALEMTDEDEPAEPGQAWLYRVFNNDSFELGGRFYGGWWMGLSKENRARLLINGAAVSELDFAGLHPRIIYDRAGTPLAPEEDPYALPGRLAGVPRDLRKQAFAQLLNTTGNIRAPRGAKARLPRRVSWKQVVEGMEARHSAVAHWFRKGRGLELQAIDARIADYVLIQMAQRGVPCLPVHDSFIVPAPWASILQAVMAASYRWVVHGSLTSGPAPIIRSSSSSTHGPG